MRTDCPSPARGARAAFAAALTCIATSRVSASLWESTNWALTGAASAAVGYDSNLTLSSGGPGDGYLQATPEVTLLRRNSLTDLRVNASITETDFLSDKAPRQTDYRLQGKYAFPSGPDIVPQYTASAVAQRTSEPNVYLGYRVRHDRFELNGQAFHPVSGKVGVTGTLQAFTDRFDDPTLSRNQRWLGFAGVGYEKRPGLLGSLELGFASGRSLPNRGNAADVSSREIYLTVRARGKLTPKITGNAYAGFGRVSYSGGYRNRYNLPIAGADLTWGIDPRRTLVLAAYSGADYAPDGQAVNTTRVFLSFTNVVIGHWQYVLRAGPTRTVFRREIKQSTDTAWEGAAEFSYIPSERFQVTAGVSLLKHRSDVVDRRYSRTVVSLKTSYRF